MTTTGSWDSGSVSCEAAGPRELMELLRVGEPGDHLEERADTCRREVRRLVEIRG